MGFDRLEVDGEFGFDRILDQAFKLPSTQEKVRALSNDSNPSSMILSGQILYALTGKTPTVHLPPTNSEVLSSLIEEDGGKQGGTHQDERERSG